MSIKYLISKIINKIQVPSLLNCHLSPHVYICPRSNLIDVTIGKYSYVGANNSMQNVDIGAFCSIGSFVAVGGKHPLDKISTSPVFYDKDNCFKTTNFIDKNCGNYEMPRTIIGNDVWIGDKVFINAGIKIGDGAVIGANSVVTHDVPAYAIVAGAPARIIRYRFDEKTIQKLLEIKWWDWDDDIIEKNKKYFLSIQSLIENS